MKSTIGLSLSQASVASCVSLVLGMLLERDQDAESAEGRSVLILHQSRGAPQDPQLTSIFIVDPSYYTCCLLVELLKRLLTPHCNSNETHAIIGVAEIQGWHCCQVEDILHPLQFNRVF